MKFVLYLLMAVGCLCFQISTHNTFAWAPDFMLIITCFLGMSEGEFTGTWAGFLVGVLEDIFSGGRIGFNAVSKGLIGWICGYVSYHPDRSPVLLMPVFFLMTILDNFLIWLTCLLVEQPVNFPGVGRILGVAVANALAGSFAVFIFGKFFRPAIDRYNRSG